MHKRNWFLILYVAYMVYLFLIGLKVTSSLYVFIPFPFLVIFYLCSFQSNIKKNLTKEKRNRISKDLKKTSGGFMIKIFEKFLKENGAEETFNKNVKEMLDVTHLHALTPIEFITGSFVWIDALHPEKDTYEFWEKLDEKWTKKLKEIGGLND